MKTPNAQKGASVTGVIFFIICIGIIAKLGLAIIPAYVGNYQLTKVVARELKQANDERWTQKQLIESIDRQLNINASYNIKAQDVLIFNNKTPGALAVTLKYTEESQLYDNTYIVNRFNKVVTPANVGGR